MSLKVTKQQFVDALFKQASGDEYAKFNFHQPWDSRFVYDAIERAGFVLIYREALEKLMKDLEESNPRMVDNQIQKEAKIAILKELLEVVK